MPDFKTEIITYLGSITCFDSSFCLNSQPSSAAKESRGDRVPDVRIIDLGLRLEIDFIPRAALKHRNSIFLIDSFLTFPLPI